MQIKWKELSGQGEIITIKNLIDIKNKNKILTKIPNYNQNCNILQQINKTKMTIKDTNKSFLIKSYQYPIMSSNCFFFFFNKL